jgi:hypothetical protein
MNKRYLRLAALAACSAIGVATASADLVINFDDLPSTAGQSLPLNYMGFNWQGDWGYMTGSGSSAPNVVYSQAGKTVSLAMADGATFDFQGASFSALTSGSSAFFHAAAASTTSVIVEGWKGTTLVGTEVFKNLGANQFTFQTSSLQGIDKLVFKSDGTPGSRWAMDDVSTLCHPGRNTPVPEPTTLIAGALLLLPFGATVVRMRRKGRRS